MPTQDDPGERQGKHGAGRIVQRRLGDDRLRDLGPNTQPFEERNEDGGIGRGERCADQQTRRQGQAE
jgi:hypothetical protein